MLPAVALHQRRLWKTSTQSISIPVYLQWKFDLFNLLQTKFSIWAESFFHFFFVVVETLILVIVFPKSTLSKLRELHDSNTKINLNVKSLIEADTL